MSDPKVESIEEGQTPPESKQEENKEQFVGRKAYEEVTRDMHKYKSRMKDAEAAQTEYEAKLKAIEEQGMAEKEQWKELYEKQKEETEKERRERQSKELAYSRSVKMSALKSELGNVRDEYLVHADINSIEFKEDGSVDPDTLSVVANDFREKHSVLIPQSQQNNITSFAPPVDSTVHTGKNPNDPSNWSMEQKEAFLMKKRQDRLK